MQFIVMPAAALASIAWAAALLGASSTAQAQDAVGYEASLGVTHRTLVERSAAGGTLLTERGWLPQVRGAIGRTLSGGGAIAGSLALSGNDIDYHGQTQAGAPLSTTTRQTELAADVLWRPIAPAAWGQAWLTGQALVNRRSIESTPTAGGLDETSSALLLGARWSTPSFAAGRWQAHAEADARISVWHRLKVDYRGLLDASSFEGARKHQWALRLVGAAADSPWGWEVEGARLKQGASEAVPVFRTGALFGTVRQPALTVEDVTVRISRRF